MGGNAVEARHPTLEPAVVGVDVLDVEGLVDHADAGAEVDGGVGNVGGLGKAAVDRGAIGAQHRIGVHEGPEHGRHGRGVGLWQYRVRGARAAVAHDQHGDLLVRQAALRGRTAALTRRARQMALALVGFEEVGLVGLDDPVPVGRLDLGREGQEAVAPAERGVLVAHRRGAPPRARSPRQ